MVSKNNPARRAEAKQEKTYQGKVVKPVLYVGTHVGHGRFVAAQDEGGTMVTDKQGKPIPFRQI